MRVSELIEELSRMNPDAPVAISISVGGGYRLEADPNDALEVRRNTHGVIALWGGVSIGDFEFVEQGEHDALVEEKNQEIRDLEEMNEQLIDALDRRDLRVQVLEDDVERLEEMVDRHEV